MNRPTFIILIITIAVALSCLYLWNRNGEEQSMTDSEVTNELTLIQRQLESKVMDLDGVVGVAISRSAERPVFLVLVENAEFAASQAIPDEIAGIAVVVEEVGQVHRQ